MGKIKEVAVGEHLFLLAEAIGHQLRRWLSDPIVDEYETIAGRLEHALYRDGLWAIIRELGQVAIVVEPTDVVFGLAPRQK